ncbi:hypothetical protein EVAR_41295_1 [Eumeta japonica]|uniref:Helitron helicase-like domain-containing protein n=1 Tax=Eumeta variegata TaxID=151549 RepID=A0A4C1XA23_EUMVA|nr:hypothetical protein EVAR_41295_1 [Eumeta japonica]
MNAYLLNIQIFRRGLYNCRGVAAITYAFCAEDPEFEPEKPSRKTYNFNRQDSSQENLEENPANEVSDQNQDLGTVFQENRFNQVNVQETLLLARPTRAAKTRCLQNLTRIINEETSYDLNVPQERNRLRASQRVASESDELREQRLGDLRRRASHRVATESNEEREHRLEEQRRRDIRRRRALESNYLPTYKCAVNADQLYHALGSFEVLCIHCGALHFPEERVSNHINRNSFSDCCLHGRTLIEPPKVPNELVRLFLKRHPHLEEFHKKIRSINASFALASFNVEDDRTINSRGIYSFIVCGQVYHKMNMAAHPTQNDEGVFERPLHGQLYFLDPDDAVNERVNHPLNSGISSSLMELLEYIIRARNGYVQGYRMMRDVEEDINRLSFAQDIHLPGQYRIANLDQIQEDLADVGQRGSTLDAYFKHNKQIKELRELSQSNVDLDNMEYHYYWQMPEHFRWVGRSKLYHLRLLLHHIKDATNFEDLRTVNDTQYQTYKQACLARGLAYDDQQWIEGLRESALSKMPVAMRSLFIQILIYGSPENPKRLWDTFKENLSEDFIHAARRNGQSVNSAINRAYRIIAHKLNTEATEGRNFQYWVRTFGFEDIGDYDIEINQSTVNADESAVLGEQMYLQLRGKQVDIVNEILYAQSYKY